MGVLPMGPSPTQTRTADTELRRGDERLRALMATLEALIDSVDADICLRDREGGLVLWNAAFGRACREVLGVEPKVGLRTVDYLAKDQRDAFDDIRQSFQRVLAGESVQREYAYRWPNGETHRYETTWVFVREGDQVTGVAETTRDVTDRATAEEERREAELKYRSVVEHANEAILVTQDEKVKYFNPRAAEWTGYSQEDFLSRSFTKFVHPADRELVRREHQERQSGKKPSARYQIRTLTKSGDVRHAIVNSVTVAWEGRPASLTLLADVTELAVAEERIRSAEAKYRTVADFTYDWEYWEAPDGRLEYVSPSCERMTGYPARDFLDRPQLLDDIVHPEDKPTWAAHRCRASSELAPGPCQFRVRTRSDETRWIEHLCRRVTDNEGRYLGIRASNRDITGLRAAEQEARSSREALARVDRVASMGALTGSIAHELNQPLTGILSNAQAAEILLQGGRCDSPGMAEILADVVSDAKRAGEMIRNLRAVFRQQPVELVGGARRSAAAT